MDRGWTWVSVSSTVMHGDGQSGRAHACMVRAWATYVIWAQRA